MTNATPPAYLRDLTPEEVSCLNHISAALLQSNNLGDAGMWPVQGFWVDGSYAGSGVYGFLNEALRMGLLEVYGRGDTVNRILEHIHNGYLYGNVQEAVNRACFDIREEWHEHND